MLQGLVFLFALPVGSEGLLAQAGRLVRPSVLAEDRDQGARSGPELDVFQEPEAPILLYDGFDGASMAGWVRDAEAKYVGRRAPLRR